MSLEFKNVKVDYIPSTKVTINKKEYLIHGVIDGEDILVNEKLKYPKLEKILKPSPERINDGCIYQDLCGGCKFMHINYDYEIKLKEKYLNDLFKPFHKSIKVTKMDNPYNYRNKCQMTYKLSNSKKVVCGLYEEYSHNIITIDNCMLQNKKANYIISAINKILTKNKIEPYDEKTRGGVLRHIFIRSSHYLDELMLVFVTNGEFFPGRNNVINDLKKLNLGITTIVQNFNSRDTSIVLGSKEKVLYGPGYIYEMVGDFKFKISPQSFFQINSIGMNILYNKAVSLAEFKKTDVVIDAYCGVGTISLFISKHAKMVYGVELNKNAVFDAKLNAKINNVKNVEFIQDDATNFMTNLARQREKIDVVMMDPPREGSTVQFINAIGYLNPKKVIYISCNPITLKRDLYNFFENDYNLVSLESVDMFPRTQHSEMIAVLKKDTETLELEELVRKENTKNYKENKIRYIPKADIEMMKNDKYEANGFKNKKKKY